MKALFARSLALLLVVAPTVLHAQVPVATLNNPSPAPFDKFGNAVAVSGTLVAVGAFSNAGGGSVYIYDLSSGTPTVPAFTLNNPFPATGANFGWSVAISGTRVVVGADNAETAYVYDVSGGNPTAPVATLNNPSPAPMDYFGTSVGISGNRLVVGAPGDTTGGFNATGSAYVYEWGSGPPPVLVATLNNPAVGGDSFGQSVAISGTRVVVGDPYNDTTAGTNSGTAYVYDMNSSTPTLPVVTMNSPIPSAGERFGASVAISGTRVAFGSPTSPRVYVLDVGTPPLAVLVATLNSPASAAVAISGTRVVAGVPFDSGIAYSYDLSSGTPTVPAATFNNPSPAPDDQFGASVAIDGLTVVIGTPHDSTLFSQSGTAYIFGPDSIVPVDGAMMLTPPSPVDASAAMVVNFSGWTDPSTPLGYTVLIDGVIVSVSGPTTSRSITGPAAPGTHTLKGRIADGFGNVAEVTQSFTVLTAQESWRQLYFGTTANTGNAADTADPDGDGGNNLFEYVAGLVPSSAVSRFTVRAEPVAGQATRKVIIFSPTIAGRTYVVKSTTSLTAPTWTALGSSSTSDNGTERTVTDLSAGSSPRFYHVEITKP